MPTDQTAPIDPFQAVVDGVPTRSVLEVFDNPHYFGVQVSFSEKGFGFGQICFAVNKETGEVSFDEECMGLDTCARFLMRAIGTTVGDGNKSAEEMLAPPAEGESTVVIGNKAVTDVCAPPRGCTR